MKIEPLSLPDLIRAAGLSIAGSAQWKTPIAAQTLSGVYVVTATGPTLAGLPSDLRDRWNEGQDIVYIG
jgi:hypothetical protein